MRNSPELEKEIKEQLKNWQAIVKKYQKPSTKAAVIQMVNTFLPFLAIWTLMYFSLSWSYWITIGLAMLNGLLLVRIFVIQHDCGHQSFFKSKKANDWVGFICSFFSSIPYEYWARAHNYHHGHTGQLEHRNVGDINFVTVNEYRQMTKWQRTKYRIFRNPLILFIMAPIAYLSISNRFPFFKFKGWGKVRKSQFTNNIWLVIVYFLLGWILGWKNFFMVQIPIVFFFGVIAFWFFYVQHQHENTYMQWKENWDYLLATIRGATYYKLPKVFQWFTGNIGFHHIHHLNSRIPNYLLEKCAKENPILQKYVTTITFLESIKCIFSKLWDEERNKMITFKEFYQMERMRLKGQ